MARSTITLAVEPVAQDPQPSSTKCCWLTAQGGPSRAVEPGSANELLRALIGKDLTEGPINIRVEPLPGLRYAPRCQKPRKATVSKNAGLFRFLHRAEKGNRILAQKDQLDLHFMLECDGEPSC